ncbi:MAG TPA: ACT domain-containing protein, partial [Caldisericia bacterium]|nr:ACT domain-containing protein [Caldisericia bacterium]
GNVDNSLEKIVKVEWANDVKILYPVKINIHIKDEPGVLNKIVSIIAKYNYNIESVNAPPSRNKEKTTTIYMTLQIPGYGKLNDLLEEIKIVPNVLEIERNS